MTALEQEALRYLGARAPDERITALVRAGLKTLEAAVPRHRLVTLPISAVTAAFDSAALRRHLAGCDHAALLAATLGTETDRLIRRAESVDTLQATVLHACAAAKIEAYCDTVQAGTPQAKRPRFSPGYADFPLSAQQTLLDLTDAGRRIGLYLTAGCMLVPSKSVTAVLGLGPALPDCPEEKCARCAKTDCSYRGDGVCQG